MKKSFRSVLSCIMAVCLLCACMITPVSAITSVAFDTREDIIAAIKNLSVTEETTAANIESAVTSVDGSATVDWEVAFTKVLPTDGAIITLNGEEVDGGTVRGFDGYIKGILSVTSEGETFDVAVNAPIKAEYETIDCTKQATITAMTASTWTTEESFYDSEADLIVLNRTGGSIDIPENYFKDNSVIKAVIIKGTGFRDVSDNAFGNTSALEAVVFNIGVRIVKIGAFSGSSVKYVDFGSQTSHQLDGRYVLDLRSNAFTTCTSLKNLYIVGYDYVNMSNKSATNIFYKDANMKQLTIDGCEIVGINSGVLNTNATENASITTVVCNNSTVAAKFEGKAAATIDLSKTPIVDYVSKVSAIKVINEETADSVEEIVESLDTESAFTVSVTREDRAFAVSITDTNSVTAMAYAEIFALSDLKVIVEKGLEDYSYTAETTNEDVEDYINNTVFASYNITWLDNYSATVKVDGAEVWAREDAESEYELYGTVPGQDCTAHGIFVVKSGTTCGIVEINKTIEAAKYEKYELTGICETDGSDGGTKDNYKTTYDGTSELVVVKGATVYTNHLYATAIDAVLGEGASSNIKAVIVNGNQGTNWTCFSSLSNLEVAIINNASVTGIGNSQFANCTKLKYVYLPDNIKTTTAGTAANAHAFNGCSPFTVLVANDFNFSNNALQIRYVSASERYFATGITRYVENASARQKVNFYNEVLGVKSAPDEDWLQSIMEELTDYDGDYDLDIDFSESGVTVTIDELLVAYLRNIYNVNDDLCVDILDLVALEYGVVDESDDDIYDINYDSLVNDYDVIAMMQKLLAE